MNKLSLHSLVLVIALIGLSACSGGGGGTAAPAITGTLDAAFGAAGIVSAPVGTGDAVIQSIAIQTDGKIVAAGYSFAASNHEFALARFNADGSLDAGFGTNGKVTTPIGTYGVAYAVAVQTDGKIVAVGQGYSGSTYVFALARYNADGTLDTGFGTNGKVLTPIGAADSYAYAVALQTDGRIVAAGQSYTGSGYSFALARYNPDGTADAGFGTNGIVVTAIGSYDAVNGLVIQSDGKIIAAGYSDNGSQYVFALARYNSSGTLDASFGQNNNGKVMTPIGSKDDEAYAVAIQADGKIVATGYSNGGTCDLFALVRYNADGTLDTGFGTNGNVTTGLGSSDQSRAVGIQDDGRIVAAGYSYTGSEYVFALVRYNVNGTLDAGFGTDGKVLTAIGSYDDEINAIAIQSDAKIVVGGYSQTASNEHFALARYQ